MSFSREQHSAYEDILAVEKRVWPQVIDVKEVNMSAQWRLWRGKELLNSNFQAALFWGINLNTLSDGPYDYLTIQAILPDGRNAAWESRNPSVSREMVDKAWNLALPEVEKSPLVLKVRKDFADLVTETTRLRLMLEDEFTKWAS